MEFRQTVRTSEEGATLLPQFAQWQRFYNEKYTRLPSKQDAYGTFGRSAGNYTRSPDGKPGYDSTKESYATIHHGWGYD